MAKLEDSIVRSICEFLGGVPRCWYLKVHGGPFQLAGVPDIVGVLGGVFFGMEVKTDTGVVSRIQEVTMQRIEHAGGRTAVVRSLDEAKTFLDGIKSGPPA